MTETVVSISLGSFDWGPLALATKTIVGLIAANFLLGVAAAMKARTFNVSYLPNFIVDDLAPAVVGLGVMAAGILTESGTLLGVGVLAVAAAAASLAPSLKRSFVSLFGVALPKGIRDALDKLLPDPPAE